MNDDLKNKGTYPFNKFFYTALFFTVAFSVFVLFAVERLFTMDVYQGTNLMTLGEKLGFIIPVFIAGVIAAFSSVSMLYQWMIVKSPVSYDEDYLYDFLIGGIFLAFIIIIPIKKVAKAHLYIDTSSLVPVVRIKPEHKQSFNWLIRFAAYIRGFKLILSYSKADEHLLAGIQTDEQLKDKKHDQN